MDLLLKIVVILLPRIGTSVSVHTFGSEVYVGDVDEDGFPTTLAFWYSNGSIFRGDTYSNYPDTIRYETTFDDRYIGPCYSFQLITMMGTYDGTIDDDDEPFKQTGFSISLDNVTLSLINQTHKLVTDYIDYNTSIDFCTTFFKNNTPAWRKDASLNSNILGITFEEYPSNLILEISDYDDSDKIYYKNNFHETTSSSSSSSSNGDNSIIFPNVKDGCFNMYMIDEYYDSDSDSGSSSLNHVNYVIHFNNNIVAYGGYYGDFELTSFCTDESEFCSYTSNECSGMYLDKSDSIVQGLGYRSYYEATIYNGRNMFLNMYGSSSFEGVDIISAESLWQDMDWYCDGAYSCYGIYGGYIAAEYNDIDIYCKGWNSCSDMDIQSGASIYGIFTLHCGATQGCSERMYLDFKIGSIPQINASLIIDGSMVVTNTDEFYLIGRNTVIEISGYYALYQTTFSLVPSSSSSYEHTVMFICLDDNFQLFYINNTDPEYTNVKLINCDNNQTTDDNITLSFIELLDEIDLFIKMSNNNKTCMNTSYCQTYDIGYPVEFENKIINSIEGGYISCRGYRSCFGAASVTSTLGNVLCLGKESCKDTQIWNSVSIDVDVDIEINNRIYPSLPDSTNGNSSLINTANVFCLGESACADSVIKSDKSIFCLSPNSCENSEILDGTAVYCTKQGCENSRISNVESVYLFDSQADMIIFSNGIENMNVYLRGIQDGNGITIYCSDGDYCTIDCGTQNACNNVDLYCVGKCNVLCDDEADIICPNMVLSVAPTRQRGGRP